jgi:hypothetical protein
MQQIIEKQGYEKALQKIAGLDKDHALIPIILEQLETLPELRK